MSRSRTISLPDAVWPYLVLAVIVFVSPWFRPVLSPDETRYLTVSWEMLVRGSYVVPTLNFAPYHNKPPLLFWLIDVAWLLFGVGRYQALLVVFAVSALAVHLTGRLAAMLFPDRPAVLARVPWILVGGCGFTVYSGMVMFDLLLACCVLGWTISMLRFARGAGWASMAAGGLALGLGVLAKGPVVLIFALWPVVLYGLWRGAAETAGTGRMLRGAGFAVLVALVPVAGWIVPALVATDGAFANSLIWQQTAGRISGNLKAAHGRPFWFFLPIVAGMTLPWSLSPYLWWRRAFSWRDLARRACAIWRAWPALRFLLIWIATAVVSFSLIAGKQPHYLVPLLPAVAIAIALAFEAVPFAAIRGGAAIMLALAMVGQAVASFTVFTRLDLQDVADLVRRAEGRPLAVTGAYQGELGFLARLRSPIEPLDPVLAAAWFEKHPDGLIVSLDRIGAANLPGPELLRRRYRADEVAVVHGLPVTPSVRRD